MFDFNTVFYPCKGLSWSYGELAFVYGFMLTPVTALLLSDCDSRLRMSYTYLDVSFTLSIFTIE
jgi:hypothetical protein